MIHVDILTLSTTFCAPKAEIKEKIARTRRPIDISLRFWSWKSFILAEYWKTYLEKIVVQSEAFFWCMIHAYLEKTWETVRQSRRQKFWAGVKIWDCGVKIWDCWCQNMDLPVSKYGFAGVRIWECCEIDRKFWSVSRINYLRK